MHDPVVAVALSVAAIGLAFSFAWFALQSRTPRMLDRYDDPYEPEPGEDEDTQPLPGPEATTVRARLPRRVRQGAA